MLWLPILIGNVNSLLIILFFTFLVIDEKIIFDLAGSGFESTVRLAKSSPEMWSPIFIQNKNYIIEALSEYIDNLEVLKQMILKNENEVIINDLNNINRIKEILSGINNKRK